MNDRIDVGLGLEFHACRFCGLPCEPVELLRNKTDFVCRHRDFFHGRGHRAHALCCANASAGREGE